MKFPSLKYVREKMMIALKLTKRDFRRYKLVLLVMEEKRIE